MLIFLFLTVLMLLFSVASLPFFLAEISRHSHQQCLLHLPDISSRDWIAALVCGERLPNPLLYKLLEETSLVHLLVISVGHLQMLSWIFEQSQRFKNFPYWLQIFVQITRWSVLLLFALMSGFHPPVVRALIAEILRSLSRHFHWHWNLFFITTASGILTLIYQPQWILALALYLPWICCLGFCVVAFLRDTRFRRRESLWQLFVTATLIQMLLALPLGEFRWEGVIANVFLMPVFGLFLFPISALTYLFHFLGPLTDFFFSVFEKILRMLLSLLHPSEMSSTPIPFFYPVAAWSLVVALSVLIFVLNRERWKNLHD